MNKPDGFRIGSVAMDENSREQYRSQHPPSIEWEEVTIALPDDLPSPPIGDKTAWNWSLVLKAMRIPHRIRRSGPGWRIFVPLSKLEDAASQIAYYEHENRSRKGPVPAGSAGFKVDWTILAVLAVGALFYAISSKQLIIFGLWKIPWEELGLADAVLIRNGEWWRITTSLTLHADPAHFYSNAAIGGVFMYVLSREIKSGPAWLIFCISGTAGNLINALVHVSGHRSLGASTAVFGVVAALAAFRSLENGHLDIKNTLAPAAAGLAILGFLGTGGENTDLTAHLFGFLAGLPLGALTGALIKAFGPPSNALNVIAGLLAALIPCYAWAMALNGGV